MDSPSFNWPPNFLFVIENKANKGFSSDVISCRPCWFSTWQSSDWLPVVNDSVAWLLESSLAEIKFWFKPGSEPSTSSSSKFSFFGSRDPSEFADSFPVLNASVLGSVCPRLSKNQGLTMFWAELPRMSSIIKDFLWPTFILVVFKSDFSSSDLFEFSFFTRKVSFWNEVELLGMEEGIGWKTCNFWAWECGFFQDTCWPNSGSLLNLTSGKPTGQEFCGKSGKSPNWTRCSWRNIDGLTNGMNGGWSLA